jgi:hypothetical protein
VEEMEECEGRHARGRICGGEERAADRWEGGDREGDGRGQEAGGRVWSARVMVGWYLFGAQIISTVNIR